MRQSATAHIGYPRLHVSFSQRCLCNDKRCAQRQIVGLVKIIGFCAQPYTTKERGAVITSPLSSNQKT